MRFIICILWINIVLASAKHHGRHPSVENRKITNLHFNDQIHVPLLLRGGGGEGRGSDKRLIEKSKTTSIPTQSTTSTTTTTTTTGTTTLLNKITRAGSAVNKKEKAPFFPIKMSELPQFISISAMMFLFIYVFTTVRDTKDTLVVSNCGAEAIPFLKLYGVMPTALLFIMGYSKLSQILDKKTLFYVTLIPFFIFYSLFAFVLFPNRDIIHFLGNSGIDESVVVAGAGSAAGNLLRYWSYSLYFIVSELWASAGVPLLFWTFANDVTSLSQAKRFYPLFAIFGNLAPIVSGKVMSYIVSLQQTSDDVGFGSTLQYLAMIKITICVGIITLYKTVNRMVNARAKEEQVATMTSNIQKMEQGKRIEIKINRKNEKSHKKEEKKKPTLGESMKELSKSSELRSLATMVICYNTCIELTEVLWKGILRNQYPTKAEYMSYMARFSQIVGMVALVLQFMASGIINTFGWKWSALITPITMATLAVPFFVAVKLSSSQGSSTNGEGAGSFFLTMAGALTIGTWQNVASKVTKYSLFDPCKEMAYIPLGPDAKVKGKAAVDVLGARLGRSIGSASQQLLVLLVGNGSIINCASYVGAAYAITIGFWVRAVSILGDIVNSHSKSLEKKEKDLNDSETQPTVSKFTIRRTNRKDVRSVKL